MEALGQIILTLLEGGKIASLTLSQWIGIAAAVKTAEPSVVALIGGLHPVFAQIAADLAKGASPAEAGANAHATIPGYASDGSVTGIPAP